MRTSKALECSFEVGDGHGSGKTMGINHGINHDKLHDGPFKHDITHQGGGKKSMNCRSL